MRLQAIETPMPRFALRLHNVELSREVEVVCIDARCTCVFRTMRAASTASRTASDRVKQEGCGSE
jgi:hypothetical protein